MNKVHFPSITALYIITCICTFTLTSCSLWQKPTWLSEVEHTLESKIDMQLEVLDKAGTPFIFELHKIDLESPQFSSLIPDLSIVYAQAFTPFAVELLKARPDVVTTVSDYKPFEPYFKKVGIANVNWSLVHEKIHEAEVKNLQTKEFTLPPDTKGWLIIALNPETREKLGFLIFSVSATEPYGNVHINTIGFTPNAQRRELGKRIMSSLFTFLPDISRISLRVLETNITARNAYHSYEFRQYTPEHTLKKGDDYDPYSLYLEYKVEESDVLQNTIKKFNTEGSNGMKDIKKSTLSGQFLGKDKFDSPVVIEWHKTSMLAPEYAALMKQVADLAAQAFLPVEIQFLKTHTEVMTNPDAYFQQFEPFFANGIEHVDWKAVEQKMQSILHGFYKVDTSTLPEETAKVLAKDIYFMVTIKQKDTGALLGFITFLIRPDYAYGDIKVTSIAVSPKEQNRGLAKLLMASIFNIAPHIKRIFLCTRVTNEYALRAYQSWGFIKDLHPTQDPHYTFNLDHWTFMEYKANQKDVLQNIAAKFEEYKNNDTTNQ